MPYDYLQKPYEPRPPRSLHADYPNLFNRESWPTARVLDAATTPSGTFFFFMQHELWEDIATETNCYFVCKIDEHVQGHTLGSHEKPPARIREEIPKVPAITPREVCVFIGLLLARSVVPNKKNLANHWRTTDEGANPRGCFGLFMTRDRFVHVSRNLHFSANDDAAAAADRA
ncbi:hypothetical protein PHMEG_0006802 [Phytophthora megakarya]|uniref:PiggyBac transposable element-derived protein domain-containing protein n=1 Tax=Phytophthora megakarya TaxID=4795 RepID=A0A225WNC7_9STRA|nr:hypothetical protein PHMEG_0006802 [Phytophthora megakarya]